MAAPKFSLIIPAYNEADYLPRLLDTIAQARAHNNGGPEAIEVIVSDNNSRDNTAAIARAHGCKVAHVEERRIAAVRNGGAALAVGEILCFTDADIRIHPQTFNVIEKTMDTGKFVAGATGIKLERMSAGIAVSYAIIVPVVWLTKVDTGVVFCRRKDFEAIRGYNEELEIAEDVRFLLDLRKLGRSRDQKLARPNGAKALSSTRKWDQHGEWHFISMTIDMLRGLGFNSQRNKDFVERYWYGEQREPKNNS